MMQVKPEWLLVMDVICEDDGQESKWDTHREAPFETTVEIMGSTHSLCLTGGPDDTTLCFHELAVRSAPARFPRVGAVRISGVWDRGLH